MKEGSVTYRITDMEESERPRERLAKFGATTLTTAELLAILIRVGIPGANAVRVGENLLKTFRGLSGLHRAAFAEVCDEPGIGPAKAAQIKAALELGHRFIELEEDKHHTIHSPADAADLVLYEMSAFDQEELWVILLDTRNQVIDIKHLYRGSVSSSQVRVAELFKDAVRSGAPNIIVVHNHPSGDPTPSPDDIAITRNIIQAGKLLDIELLDHLVIGRGHYVSLKERGMGF